MTTNYDKVIYRVTTGDNLSGILQKYFGKEALQLSNLNEYLETIKQDNPQITDVNKIYPGQAILIRVPAAAQASNEFLSQHYFEEQMGVCTADYGEDPSAVLYKQLLEDWPKKSSEEQDALQALAPFYLSTTLGLGSATMTASSIDTLFKTNAPALNQIKAKYEAYKAGRITKGQYDYARRKILDQLQRNLGPVNKLLYGKQKPHEIIRINRSANAAPTGKITHNYNRLSRLSKVASKGGVALSVVGLGVSCHQVANASTIHKKNEIIYETLGSTATGVVYGAVVGILIASNPVGWVAALVIGAGGVAASYGGGKGAAKLYTSLGEEVDVAHFSTINQVCANVFNK